MVTLKLKTINKGWGEDAKGELVRMMRVEIANKKGKLKLIYNDELSNLPSEIRNLDGETDIGTEVEVDINIHLKSRQKRIDDVSTE